MYNYCIIILIGWVFIGCKKDHYLENECFQNTEIHEPIDTIKVILISIKIDVIDYDTPYSYGPSVNTQTIIMPHCYFNPLYKDTLFYSGYNNDSCLNYVTNYDGYVQLSYSGYGNFSFGGDDAYGFYYTNDFKLRIKGAYDISKYAFDISDSGISIVNYDNAKIIDSNTVEFSYTIFDIIDSTNYTVVETCNINKIEDLPVVKDEYKEFYCD